MNHVSLVGRLTADPQIKQTSAGISTATFTVAVDKKYNKDKEREADFIRCKAWRGTAEFISKYFFKGQKIGILGRIETGSYTDNDGKKVYTTEVIAEDVEFVERRQESYTGNDEMQSAESQTDTRVDTDADLDLPF